MQFMLAIPTIVTVLVLAYIGFLVIRNSRDATNKLFIVFLVSDSLWLSAVFLITNSIVVNAYLGRFTYAISLVLIMAIQAFTNSLLHIEHSKVYKTLLFGGGTAVALLTFCTDLIIKEVSVKQAIPYPVYGVVYPLFTIYLIGSLLTYLIVLFKRWTAVKKAREIAAKRQIDIVALGLSLFVIISLTTNFILPAIFGNAAASQFALAGSLMLALSLFYAIGRYRLFDIRTAVVRSTTYIFLITLLALAFVFTANAAGALVTAFKSHKDLQQIFNATLALIIAVSFQPLKRAFNRLSNRYFFRDSYDTQDVVDRLNNILISNVDMHKLLSLCEGLLTDTLKLDFSFIGVFTDKEKLRIISSDHAMLVRHYAHLRHELFELPDKVVSLRNLPPHRKDLHDLYQGKSISAIGKMTSRDDIVGFIVFGNKKNGSPLSSQDLAVLSIAADQVAIAAQNVLRFTEIENFNATLQAKIDDATRKLRHANDKLRRLNDTKDDFISMASHQLRTPLTSVKGYVSMVLDGDAGKISNLQRRLLTQSFVSAQRMVYLISDLLNVSRLKTGKFIIEPARCNLAKVVQEEVDQLVETAKSRHVHLTYQRPEHFPIIMIDETKLRQVIMNFLDNAVYYTPAGGNIEVHLVDKPQSIEFSVVDDGIGVPRHEQHHLFTKFYRAPNAKRARPDGTGLGLFMAKKVVIAQGGAVIFRSQEGKGSMFGFTFAKSHLHAEETTPQEVKPP